MKLARVDKKTDWDDFIAAAGGDFLQSWDWGEFQRQVGHQVDRLALFDDQGRMAAAVSFITQFLPGGKNYWFCPRGPVLASADATIWNALVALLKERAGEEVLFWRFEPTRNFSVESVGRHLVRTLDVEPSRSLCLDLNQSEDELLQQMNQKTRYNIRLAQKRGVTVEISRDAEEWWRLLRITARRDHFRLHDKKYYQKMLALPAGRLYLARHRGRALAGLLAISFGQTAVYVHGASDDGGRHLMAPYLLQWTALTSARAAGLRYYDFYGADVGKWPGVTRFKQGFGGRIISYPGTFDLVFRPGYYRVYQWLRWCRRLGR